MKVGVIPINIGVQAADQVVQTAQLVESLGYESVWTFEHVIVPVDYESKYPYNKSGNMGAAPETNFVDPLIALAAVAAATSGSHSILRAAGLSFSCAQTALVAGGAIC